MSGTTLSEVGSDGVAVITIFNPPLNLLSVEVLLSLRKSIDEALSRDTVKAIVITGSNGKFSGGFYVSSFGGRQGSKEKRGLGFMSIEIITNTIEAARKPIVAAIDGPALGGGLEVALASHARISTLTAQLGLTELRYGILPDLERLPRLVGLSNALEMMLLSKIVNGKDAQSLGLVDAIAPADELINIARYWALDILEYRKPWVISLHKIDKLEPLAEARTKLHSARLYAQKQFPNLRHPLVCIDVVEEGIISSPYRALWKEAEALYELRQSDTCKSLVHFFFAQRQISKIPGITDLGLTPRKINKIAIVGGANLQTHLRKRKMTQENIDKIHSLLKAVLSYDSFKDMDLVIEAVTDNVSAKQQIFAELENHCHQHCIFASNTYAVDLNLIGERTTSQNRIVGLCFLGLGHAAPLLEIVRSERTTPQVIVDLLDVGKRMKKTSIVVGNCSSSVVGRMLFPFTQTAILLVEHGADLYWIDQAITKFGMSVGPFSLIDMVRRGVAFSTATQYAETYPERTYKSLLIPVLQELQVDGESIHKGFYVYDDNGKASPDPEIKKYIDKARSLSGVAIEPKLMKLADNDIVEMILFPIVNEACRILEEGITVKASDIDVASVLGMGFPSYSLAQGRNHFWANNIGSRHICSKLEDWSMMYGEVFKPCAYLAERASKGTMIGGPGDQQGKPRL
ncbi:3-hydroxybutyryl-CoA epimerase [Bertholletia excelsa]